MSMNLFRNRSISSDRQKHYRLGSAVMNWIGFYASRSSSIYGNSTTVQPASYTVMYYIKAA